MSVISAKENFGASLRELRIERGMSVNEVAEETGIHANNISGYESGNRPLSIERADELACYYGRQICLQIVASTRIEDIGFCVIYGGQFHGIGLDSETAWREAELSLNIDRETLKDMGYFLREARVTKE